MDKNICAAQTRNDLITSIADNYHNDPVHTINFSQLNLNSHRAQTRFFSHHCKYSSPRKIVVEKKRGNFPSPCRNEQDE